MVADSIATNDLVELVDETFVGRLDELESMISAAMRAEGQSSTEHLGVAAPAGYGKSALLTEFRRRHLDGIVATGRYDGLGARSYGGLADALTDLVQRFERSRADSIDEWRQELQDAVGSAAAAITALVPGVGPHLRPSGVAELAAGEQGVQRLHAAIVELVRSVAAYASPIVLIVDDLHWAEPATFDVLEDLISSDIGGLLVVGAWRPEQAPSAAQLFGDAVVRLELLSAREVRQFLEESVRATPAPDVAKTVQQRTKGHPLFVKELLRQVLADGTLHQSDLTGEWVWDRERLSLQPLADGFVELLRSVLDELPSSHSEVLSAVACLDTDFTLRDAVDATGHLPDVVGAALDSGERHHLVLRLEDDGEASRYRFSHDRIGEVCRDRLDPRAQQSVRVRLGRALRDADGTRLFDAVTHLSAGIGLVEDSEERDEFVRLAAEAGRRARADAAFSLAMAYYGSALEAARTTPSIETDLRAELALGAAEAAWVLGDADLERLLDEASSTFSHDPVHRARTAFLRIKVDLAEHRADRALELGLEALAQLGLKLPRRRSNPAIAARIARTSLRLRKLSDEEIESLPWCDDPVTIETMSLMLEMTSILYAVEPDLLPYVILEAVELTLDRGRCPASPVAFGGYGLLMAFTNLLGPARRFGELAMRMAEDDRCITHRPWTRFYYYDFISHWHRPIQDSIAGIRAAYREALQIGDLEYAGYMCAAEMGISIYGGVPLDEIDARATARLAAVRSQSKQVELTLASQQLIRNLQGENEEPVRLCGSSGYDEDVVVPRAEATNDQVTLSVHWYAKLLAAFFAGEYGQALEFGERLQDHAEGLNGTVVLPLCNFATAMSHAVVGTGAKSSIKVQLSIRTFKRLAATCPHNFEAPFLILSAERKRRSDRSGARTLFNRAITVARTVGNPLFGALAAERLADLERDDRNLDQADMYRDRAIEQWSECGVRVKVDRLRGLSLDASPNRSVGGELRAERGRRVTPSTLVTEMAEVAAADRAIYFRVLGTKPTPLLVAEGGRSRRADGDRSASEHLRSLLRYVLEDRSAVFVSDTSIGTYRRDDYARARPAPFAASAIPLVGELGTVGAVYLEHDRPRSLTPSIRRHLHSLANEGARIIEVDELAQRVATSDAECRAMVASQARLVPPRVLNAFGIHDVRELKARQYAEAVGTIAFIDIRASVRRMEHQDRYQDVALIGRFTERVGSIITAHRGEAVALRGDMVLAFFPTGPNDAVLAAMDMMRTQERRDLWPTSLDADPEQWRVGLHHGSVAIAAFQGAGRTSIELVGDSVNVGARIQQEASKRDIEVLMSEDVRDRLDSSLQLLTQRVGPFRPRNRSGEIILHEVARPR